MSADKSNIVLIGMPGAGKSTVGIVLAKMLSYDFIDVDLLIQRRYGKTLQELIDTHGAEGFIALEGEVLCALEPPLESTVIATGGSAVYSEKAMDYLASFAQIVYLKISYAEMEKRLGDLSERGVVLRQGNGMDLRDLYDERAWLYERFAEATVDVGDFMIAEAAETVRKAIR